MNETEYAKLNIIEGSDKVNYAILNENTRKIEDELMRKAIRNTVTGTTAAVTATGPWYAVTNSTAEDISVTINGEAVPVAAESTVKVDVENIENDFEISLSSETDVTLTYFVTVKSYVDSHGGGGGGGTSNYNDLSNRPSINNITLAGNKAAADLGLVAAEKDKGLSTNDFTATYKKQLDDLPGVLNDKANSSDIGAANGIASLGSDGKVPSSQLPGSVAQKEYRIAEEASTSYAKVYKLQQKSGETWADITGSSAINIPKDMVVESGSVKECTTDNVPVSGYKKGDKYIDLVIANKADAHIYINVKDLINNEASGIKYSNSESRLTATNVQGAIDEIARTLKNTIESPNAGEVGHVLTIKTVDSSGKPTEWEYTAKGGGSGSAPKNTYDANSEEAISGKGVADAINGLDVTDTEETGKYVSAVSETNGKITVTRANLPTSLPASDVTDDYSATGTVPVSGKAVASAISGKLDANQKGTANGVAELDANGKVLSSQLPSYVDDVVEASSKSAFPTTGESGKIYVDTTANLTYRWTGTAYVEISPSLALGENESTAYRGDRGKVAYDHATTTATNPHGTTKSDVGLGNVGDFKAVSTVASQVLTDTEKSNARTNIGAGTVTKVKVGSSGTEYSPSSGVVTIPAYPTSLPASDVQAYAKTGSGITVGVSVPSNAKFTDTTYSNKAASSGGEEVSLVTTGEKYTWNNKVSAPQTATVGQILAVKTVDSSGKPTEWKTIANSASGTSVKIGSSGQKYDPTDGVVTIPAYPATLPANGGTAENVSGTVAVANGGTGATTAANARTNLGLGNVGNFKAVSTAASQGLTTTEKSNARTNLGLGDAATKSATSSVSSSSTNLPTSAAVASAISTQKSDIDNEYKNYSVDITNAIIAETTFSDSLFSGTPTVTYAGLIYNKNEVYINIRVRGTIRSAMKTKNYGSIFRLSKVNLESLISSYASVIGVGYQVGNTKVQVISSLDNAGKLFVITPQGTIGELEDDSNISLSLTYLR